MLEGFTLSPVEWSATTLLALVVLLVLFGRLVPVSQLRAAEKREEYMRDIAITALHANTLTADSVAEMTETARTTAHVMGAAQQKLADSGGYK